MKVCIKEHLNLDIRLANRDDILSLIEICRKSFPDRAIWQGPRFYAKRTWDAILSWDNNETWVCSVDGQVSGFITLLVDFVSFHQEWKKQRENFLFVKVYSCIFSPKFFFNKVWKKMLAYLRRFKNNKRSFNISELKNKNHLWIAILAVAPEMRRRGVAKIMIEQTKRRAVDLGKEVVSLKVDIRNSPARKLYEKMGFIYTYSDFEYCYYRITLNGKS